MSSVFGALTVVFAVAKILGLVDWSWFIVFLPSIVGFVFSFLVGAITQILKGLSDLIE